MLGPLRVEHESDLNGCDMGELSFRAQTETREGAQGPQKGGRRSRCASGWREVVRQTVMKSSLGLTFTASIPSKGRGPLAPSLPTWTKTLSFTVKKREKRTQRKRENGRRAVITARQPILGRRREELFRRWPASGVNSKSGCLRNKRAPVGFHPPP